MKARQKATPVTIEMTFDPTAAYAIAVLSAMKARPSSTTSAVLVADLPAGQAPAQRVEPAGGAAAGPDPYEPNLAGGVRVNRWSASRPPSGWIRSGGAGSERMTKIITVADTQLERAWRPWRRAGRTDPVPLQ
ncbi:hypothetical protein Phou_105120 [Phytohabitans houttuyneae]|uniref:Uncharacterized protein n=1 Tax=Phytohabitans houttuyneae TaxID=1076126 RepID=A0A6V8KMD1_9ACTN|nr:hypothetical protein Phou_105120 [Phytohabitans houttuyneae]